MSDDRPITRRSALRALCGVAAARGATGLAGGSFGQAAIDDPDEIYAMVARGPAELIARRGGRVRLLLAPGFPRAAKARIGRWIALAAAAVETYYGRFPVAEHKLLILPAPGGEIGHATTWGYSGAITRFFVGLDTPDSAFARDWKLTHEMVHTAFPNLPRRALWLQEGNATFIEPLARAQAAQRTPAEVWDETLTGLPRGTADVADGGMDGTLDHERLYWGGAQFWLLAAIAIDRKSGGRRSLRDAFRAVNRESGGERARWTPEQVMMTGDRAVGGHALSTLYRRFADEPMRVDTAALLARLGVSRRDRELRIDDGAPLAPLRRRLTDPAHG